MHTSCIPHVLPMYNRSISFVYSCGIVVVQVVDGVTNYPFSPIQTNLLKLRSKL